MFLSIRESQKPMVIIFMHPPFSSQHPCIFISFSLTHYQQRDTKTIRVCFLHTKISRWHIQLPLALLHSLTQGMTLSISSVNFRYSRTKSITSARLLVAQKVLKAKGQVERRTATEKDRKTRRQKGKLKRSQKRLSTLHFPPTNAAKGIFIFCKVLSCIQV